jgi:putative ABC transport system substrate-binding protein
MNRRIFIAGAVGIVAAVRANAQSARAIPIVGVLITTALTIGMNAQTIATLRKELRDRGHVEGQNIVLEIRSANGNPDALPGLVEELVQMNAAILCAFGPAAVRAAVAAPKTISVVALDLESDPVQAGWAQSLARPGGNVTGLFLNQSILTGKWLELLREAIPVARRIAVLWDSTTGLAQVNALEATAQQLGIDPQVLPIRTTDDVAAALHAAAAIRGPRAMVMLSSPIIRNSSKQIAEFTVKSRLPAISPFRPFAELGGLMSYGPDLDDFFRRCAGFVDKVLKGAKPADLPLEQPTRFELVVNTKAGKALGLTIPQALLVRADEVIQ